MLPVHRPASMIRAGYHLFGRSLGLLCPGPAAGGLCWSTPFGLSPAARRGLGPGLLCCARFSLLAIAWSWRGQRPGQPCSAGQQSLRRRRTIANDIGQVPGLGVCYLRTAFHGENRLSMGRFRTPGQLFAPPRCGRFLTISQICLLQNSGQRTGFVPLLPWSSSSLVLMIRRVLRNTAHRPSAWTRPGMGRALAFQQPALFALLYSASTW